MCRNLFSIFLQFYFCFISYSVWLFGSRCVTYENPCNLTLSYVVHFSLIFMIRGNLNCWWSRYLGFYFEAKMHNNFIFFFFSICSKSWRIFRHSRHLTNSLSRCEGQLWCLHWETGTFSCLNNYLMDEMDPIYAFFGLLWLFVFNSTTYYHTCGPFRLKKSFPESSSINN